MQECFPHNLDAALKFVAPTNWSVFVSFSKTASLATRNSSFFSHRQAASVL